MKLEIIDLWCMEFASYGYDEYTSEVDDYGGDLLSDVVLMQYEDAIHVLEFDSLKGILRAADDFIKNTH